MPCVSHWGPFSVYFLYLDAEANSELCPLVMLYISLFFDEQAEMFHWYDHIQNLKERRVGDKWMDQIKVYCSRTQICRYSGVLVFWMHMQIPKTNPSPCLGPHHQWVEYCGASNWSFSLSSRHSALEHYLSSFAALRSSAHSSIFTSWWLANCHCLQDYLGGWSLSCRPSSNFPS